MKVVVPQIILTAVAFSTFWVSTAFWAVCKCVTVTVGRWVAG